jgi:hypothetical protein
MGVIVTRETVDGMYHFYTVEADTSDPTPRRPAVDAARRAWERLWSNECLDARARAMAGRTDHCRSCGEAMDPRMITAVGGRDRWVCRHCGADHYSGPIRPETT